MSGSACICQLCSGCFLCAECAMHTPRATNRGVGEGPARLAQGCRRQGGAPGPTRRATACGARLPQPMTSSAYQQHAPSCLVAASARVPLRFQSPESTHPAAAQCASRVRLAQARGLTVLPPPTGPGPDGSVGPLRLRGPASGAKSAAARSAPSAPPPTVGCHGCAEPNSCRWSAQRPAPGSRLPAGRDSGSPQPLRSRWATCWPRRLHPPRPRRAMRSGWSRAERAHGEMEHARLTEPPMAKITARSKWSWDSRGM